MHIADLDKGMLGANGIVGGGSPQMIGAALTAKTLGTGGVAVAFVGDGASNQGTTFESLNMAVVLNLPAIFVFENNYIGEGTGVDYAVGSRNIANRAAGFGLPVEKVDGCDFFAVHEAFGACAERARSGGGPSGFEVTAPRFYGHFEGDPQLYRGDGEVDDLRANRDCLKLFRRRVTEAGLLDAAALDEIEAAAHTEIETAVAVAREGAPPGPDDLMTDVYASAY
jgi:pyruvate dehydrogenase E1 component alpha subunit